MAQAQYWVTPTVVAATIGPTAAGLLQWAAGNGRKPLDFLEQLARVALPHFSRLQHDGHEVAETLSRYASGFVLLSGFWLLVVAVAGRDLVHFTYTDQWLPALPAPMAAAVGAGVLVRTSSLDPARRGVLTAAVMFALYVVAAWLTGASRRAAASRTSPQPHPVGR